MLNFWQIIDMPKHIDMKKNNQVRTIIVKE
jgi:hypothetical protein